MAVYIALYYYMDPKRLEILVDNGIDLAGKLRYFLRHLSGEWNTGIIGAHGQNLREVGILQTFGNDQACRTFFLWPAGCIFSPSPSAFASNFQQ